jgi:hypothetical protein
VNGHGCGQSLAGFRSHQQTGVRQQAARRQWCAAGPLTPPADRVPASGRKNKARRPPVAAPSLTIRVKIRLPIDLTIIGIASDAHLNPCLGPVVCAGPFLFPTSPRRLQPLRLARASKSRPSDTWSDDEYDVFYGGQHVGRINCILTKRMRAPLALYIFALMPPIIELDFTFALAVLLGTLFSLALLNWGR